MLHRAGENLAIVVGNAQPDLRDWAMQRQAVEPQLPSGKHRLLLVGGAAGCMANGKLRAHTLTSRRTEGGWGRRTTYTVWACTGGKHRLLLAGGWA